VGTAAVTRTGGGVGHQGHDGAEDHDDQADPNPRYQRIDVGFDDGASSGFVLAFVDEIEVAHQEEIFAEAGIDAGEGLGLSAGFVETALWEHSRDLLARRGIR